MKYLKIIITGILATVAAIFSLMKMALFGYAILVILRNHPGLIWR